MTTTLDFDSLLDPIGPNEPSGPNLEYEPAYLELMTAARGKPEQVMGDSVIAAEPPDWQDVRDRCIGLMDRTKDLSVVVRLVRAQVQTHRLAGMRDGLALLDQVIDRFWSDVHPQLDPEEPPDEQATERVNILESLNKPRGTFGDELQFLQAVCEIPLTDSRMVGRFSLRDIESVEAGTAVTTGQDDAEGSAARVVDSGTIDSAFQDTDLEQMQADGAAVTASLETVASLKSRLAELVTFGAPTFDDVVRVLRALDQVLSRQLELRGVGVASPVDSDIENSGDSRAAAAPAGLSGEVRSREEVATALDKVCRYYQAQEPASPVPLLLEAARRVARMSFMEISRSLPPDLVRSIEEIGSNSE